MFAEQTETASKVVHKFIMADMDVAIMADMDVAIEVDVDVATPASSPPAPGIIGLQLAAVAQNRVDC